MQVGLGWLRLPPAAFWQMTPREFAAALEGWMTINGLAGPAEGLSRAESEALRAFLAEDAS
ncbi:phage tail assembly chaperone [Aquibaculum arenosum]|uniref:Phage tail assembly chaperone n=1 Tax=Aquibaculum arenosum TaxID=3032591 RepID=A0ABT5YRE6_9PROT|nr:phage tail assembly chaperone [Fodinicurvata sp. CAU 1616]MDF2097315.1 phage tail assembly chaperone [Fodinicurvata sp. CAU 1616]